MKDKSKTILVTGADGFIGSHLTEMLLAEGYKVRALSYYNSFNNWGWLEGVDHPALEVVSGDVRDPDFCRHITNGCGTVFHLAALIAIPYSYVAPDSYVDTNIRGTLNMCRCRSGTYSRHFDLGGLRYRAVRSHTGDASASAAITLFRHKDRSRCDSHELL